MFVLHGMVPLVGFGILDSSGRDSKLGRKAGTVLAKSLRDLGQFWQGFYAWQKSCDSSGKVSLGLGTVLAETVDWVQKLGQFWQGPFET